MITQIFCDTDDFYKNFWSIWRCRLLGDRKESSSRSLSMSEIMTIVIFFHLSGFRKFKDYYTKHVCIHLRKEFPDLVSYNRFVELMQGCLFPLMAYLKISRMGKVTGISFIDSTDITVCDNRRIHNHKVFESIAQRGKSSMGWFYGFKLHLVVNDKGELLSFTITPGNVSDINPNVIDILTKNLFGQLFGDRGYISSNLFQSLLDNGIQLVTKVRKNMKNKLMPLVDKILLRKRALIETINDELKNMCQIEHTRHRSIANFMVNLISGLTAYTYFPKKPSLHLEHFQDFRKPLPVFAF